LTDAERLALTTAMRTFMDRADESVDDFVAIHRLHARAVHGGPIFLPWHRLFLLDFEDALRVVDPSVVLPYCTFGDADSLAGRLWRAKGMNWTVLDGVNRCCCCVPLADSVTDVSRFILVCCCCAA